MLTLAPPTDEGHFDRWETLKHLLETHKPSVPEDMSLSLYKRLSASRRSEFVAQRAARIAGGVVVGTREIEDLDLEIRRAELFANRPLGRTGVILNGPPTTGKTTAAFSAMVQAFRRHERRYPDWRRDGHIPVVYVEVPPGSTAKGIMGRFLRFLGVQFIEKMTLEERTKTVTEQLQAARTSLIVIDEMQNLARVSNGSFESAQAIKNLLNAVKCVPLYVGFKLDRVFAHDDIGKQFSARSTIVELERMTYGTPNSKKMWRGMIRAFETQFGLFGHPTGTLIPDADYLFERTKGSIAALSRLLTVAALELLEEEPEEQRITVDRLRKIRLDQETESTTEADASETKGHRRAA